MRYRYPNLLNIPEATRGRWAIAHKTEPPTKKLYLATPRTAMHGQRAPAQNWVAYPFETRWHYLKENEGVWMSDTPIEQYQHRTAIAPMRGHILVGGLGLGVAATMLAKKRTVESIVVVEKNKAVIDLVWPHLSGAVHRKAMIIHEDLFVYLRKQQMRRIWTYALYDIWASDSEDTFHRIVVPLRKLSQIRVGHVHCWNEDVMRGQLLAALHARMDMLDRPIWIRPSNLTNDQIKEFLLTDRSIYQRWSRPFWRRFYTEKRHGLYWREEAYRYAMTYGKEFP